MNVTDASHQLGCLFLLSISESVVLGCRYVRRYRYIVHKSMDDHQYLHLFS